MTLNIRTLLAVSFLTVLFSVLDILYSSMDPFRYFLTFSWVTGSLPLSAFVYLTWIMFWSRWSGTNDRSIFFSFPRLWGRKEHRSYWLSRKVGKSEVSVEFVRGNDSTSIREFSIGPEVAEVHGRKTFSRMFEFNAVDEDISKLKEHLLLCCEINPFVLSKSARWFFRKHKIPYKEWELVIDQPITAWNPPIKETFGGVTIEGKEVQIHVSVSEEGDFWVIEKIPESGIILASGLKESGRSVFFNTRKDLGVTNEVMELILDGSSKETDVINDVYRFVDGLGFEPQIMRSTLW